MEYTLKDLIAKYAEYYKMTEEEAAERYEDGEIGKKDLLEAYLYDEGIFGYTDTLWGIFEAFVDVVPVVHAKWVYDGGYNTCTACHNEVAECDDSGRRQSFDICPRCGAKMDLEAT